MARLLWAGVIHLLVLGGPSALAQQPARVSFEVMASHVSPEPGSIDPKGAEIHRVLRKEIRYESLRVLGSRKLDLRLNDIGTFDLPTGTALRLRPLDIGEAGVLVAVDVEGKVKTDLRVPNGQTVVIGGWPHEEGRLVVTLKPRF